MSDGALSPNPAEKQSLAFLAFLLFFVEILTRLLILCLPQTRELPESSDWLISAHIRLIAVAILMLTARRWQPDIQINWGLRCESVKREFLLALPFIIGGTAILALYHWDIGSLRSLIGPAVIAPDLTQLAVWIVAAVAIAPLCEELLFRAILYPALRSYCGGPQWLRTSLATLISSTLFAALHLPELSLAALPSALFPFICGLLGCAFFQWRKNIAVATIVHAFANLYLFILAYL